jgi:Fic family protein
MFGYEYIDLKNKKQKRFYYNRRKIAKLKQEIEEYLETDHEMNSLDFTLKMIFSIEIKTNNAIEDIINNLDEIEATIKERSVSESEKNKILNLYYGYRYILRHKNINEETLNKLYKILSKNLLDEYSLENMGELYRTQNVYILNRQDSFHVPDYDLGIPPEQVESYMNDLFTYLNQETSTNPVDIFIKSQIMHFYFVYVHPYFDVNGRTARTFSLWYLLNNKAYPFLIFNRAISLTKGEYKQSILSSRRGNITPFLEYSLRALKSELEKESIICSIRENTNETLTTDDYEILEYILTVPTHSLESVIRLYQRYNTNINYKQILLEKIYPLVEKNIIIIDEEFKKVRINKELVTLNKNKIKQLSLEDCVS